jgi:hypothetical protein
LRPARKNDRLLVQIHLLFQRNVLLVTIFHDHHHVLYHHHHHHHYCLDW